jgi:methyl-accepting chemotaxis protein
VALAVTALLRYLDPDSGEQKQAGLFGVVGGEVDAVMIGAAETAYFVDSVKKKIDHDVAVVQAMVSDAEQVAENTARIADNAGQAAAAQAPAPSWKP